MAHLTSVFRLGRDAEKHDSDKGVFLSLSLAYDAFVNGQNQTQWVRATLGGKRAEALADSLTKGTQIYTAVEDLHLHTFKSNEGAERAVMQGRINSLDFVGQRKETPANAE